MLEEYSVETTDQTEEKTAVSFRTDRNPTHIEEASYSEGGHCSNYNDPMTPLLRGLGQ